MLLLRRGFIKLKQKDCKSKINMILSKKIKGKIK